MGVVPPCGPRAPRTATVLALLAAAALTFSYLGAYAASDALVAADVLSRWPAGTDPRPRWMLGGFAVLMGLFVVAAVFARFVSRRQLRRIDAMAEEAGGE